MYLRLRQSQLLTQLIPPASHAGCSGQYLARIDLAGFNALNTDDKATVAQGVINARPVDGYRSKAVLQAALDNAVDNVQDLNALECCYSRANLCA
jgi:hypothetical protein